VSLGKRTLEHVDHGKMAATFVETVAHDAVRIIARDGARQAALAIVPDEPDARRAQTIAYRTMAESELLRLERVTVDPGWLERRRVRVACSRCGESVGDERQVWVGGHALCRSCAGESYYAVAQRMNSQPAMTAVITPRTDTAES
jgi:formylmethanofuran dehydrogenase subunit E